MSLFRAFAFTSWHTATLSLLLGTGVVTGSLATPPPAAEQPADPPGTFTAQIVLDQTPQERGLVVDRGNGTRPGTVELAGRTHDAWIGTRYHDPHRRWERSIAFKVTDERFLDGRSPAVDVEIEYHLPAAASVVVTADTAQGAQVVGRRFGQTRNWTTLKFTLDNARFASHPAENDPLGGFHFRLTGANADLHVRRIRLTGHHPHENVPWSRMLKTDQIRAQTPGEILAFRREPGHFTVDVQNLAFVDRPLTWQIHFQDYHGRSHTQLSGELFARASQTTPLQVNFDPSDWPLGPYIAHARFLADDQQVAEQRYRLGVISSEVLPKARTGEFLYGLDAANNTIYPTDTPAARAYYRLMGTDFLRCPPYFQHPDAAALRTAMSVLAEEDLRAAYMVDLPRPAGEGQPVDARVLAQRQELLVTAAREFAGTEPGQIFLFELGNEPDLPGFWPGTIPQYLEVMNPLAEALAAVIPTDALQKHQIFITPGGLSFAGEVGDRRSRELLNLLDATKVNAIAFHGHGPRLAAERHAVERLEQAMIDAGLPAMPIIETESGYSATNDATLLTQARTVVEKMTYAQQVGMPAFIYFRLFMEGGRDTGYGMTTDFVQPRPSVLSYRAMVQRLRHHHFAQDLQAGERSPQADLSLLLFSERDAAGAPTGRKTLVSFSAASTPQDVVIRLDAIGEAVHDLAQFDLYGNALPVRVMPGHLLRLQVGEDATFTTWRSAGSPDAAHIVPPILALEGPPQFLSGATHEPQLIVRNPTDRPQQVQLQLSAGGPVPIVLAPTSVQLELAAGSQIGVPLTLAIDLAEQPLTMPRWWRVFTDVTLSAETAWDRIPATLPTLDGGTTAGQQLWAPNLVVDAAAIGGAPRDGRPAAGFATLHSPTRMDLPVAASADWYMAWYVNGRTVYDTLTAGNQHGGLADHRFTLPLEAGENVIAFQLRSGRHGWSIQFAGPRERALAETRTDPHHYLRARLTSAATTDEGLTATELIADLPLDDPLAPLPAGSAPDTLATWWALEPAAVLEGEAVLNRFYKEPDQRRWYHGSDDLSAWIWVRDAQDAGAVVIAVAVQDDRIVTGTPEEGDSVHLQLRPAGGPTHEATWSLGAPMADDAVFSKGQVQRATHPQGGSWLLYTGQVAAERLGTVPFELAIEVRDNDGFGLKQTAAFTLTSRRR